MRELVSCVAIEQGDKFTFVVIAIGILLIGAVVYVIRRVLGQRAQSKGSKVELKVAEYFHLSGDGRGVHIVEALVVAAFLGVLAGGAWLWYRQFENHYAAAIDAQAKDTLESIRANLLAQDSRSRLTVEIEDGLQSFPVRGSFDGACVADLFKAICRLYARELQCEEQYGRRTLVIIRRSQHPK